MAAAAAIVGLGIALWPSSSGSDQDEAEDLVAEWADATTARDFEEAAAIDPSRTADELVTLYGGPDDPVRMISMQAYIDEATQEGDLWRLTGAAFAVDYDPEPETRTHVICSDWMVDLDVGNGDVDVIRRSVLPRRGNPERRVRRHLRRDLHLKRPASGSSVHPAGQ